jgi:hypothetical protein
MITFATDQHLFPILHSLRAGAMSLVGTLLFCETCGHLLDRPTTSKKTIRCEVCGGSNKSTSPVPRSPFSFPTDTIKTNGLFLPNRSPNRTPSLLPFKRSAEMCKPSTTTRYRRGLRSRRLVRLAITRLCSGGICSCAERMRERRYFIGARSATTGTAAPLRKHGMVWLTENRSKEDN